MIFAAQHVGDTHQRIIHGIGEKKLRGSIGPANDEIADVVAGETLRPANPVGKFNHSASRRPETQSGLQPPLQPRLALSIAQSGAGSCIAWRTTRCPLRFAAQRQFCRGTKAG
jgi:hypothetical protein